MTAAPLFDNCNTTVTVVCDSALVLIPNFWGSSYHGFIKTISWLLMHWLLHRQVFSSHDIDYMK